MNFERLDAYEQFFDIIPKETFFTVGVENIICIDKEKVKSEWNSLLSRIENKCTNLYVQNSGRNGSGNNLLSQLYNDVFGIRINYDQTNNNQPSMLIQKLTGRRKNKTIFNYQVSHVFGRTKNVYCFTAPWNIVFIPKIVDPFTGHEAKGDYVVEFKAIFEEKIKSIFTDEISKYNSIMKICKPKVTEWLNVEVDEKDHNNFIKEFEEI